MKAQAIDKLLVILMKADLRLDQVGCLHRLHLLSHLIRQVRVKDKYYK